MNKVEFFTTHNFSTEKGAVFKDLRIAYTKQGVLNAAKDNVVCVFHPFTASPDPCQWWSGLFGHGKVFDLQRYCVICINILGSPYGSTSPLDINPDTLTPYFDNFPEITPRDIVRCFELLMEHLSIEQIKVAIGASMGGQLVFQLISRTSLLIHHAIIIAANEKITPWMISSHHVQRNALYLDPTWGEAQPKAGLAGMKIARQIGFLSYRSHLIFSLFETLNTHRSNFADEEGFALDVEEDSTQANIDALRSYVEYQGDKFLQRFNAFSYYALLNLMDSHDIGVGHDSLQKALQSITANVLLIGVDSDVLFPPNEIKKLAHSMKRAVYREISSVYGHDAFLIEYKQLEDIIFDYFYQIDFQYGARN